MSDSNLRRFQLGHIYVVGPTACGKSVIYDCITKALRDELGVHVVTDLNGRESERTNIDALPGWERRMVQGTVWALVEVNEPRPAKKGSQQ